LPTGWSMAEGVAINDSGQVAGWGVNGAGIDQAFIGTARASQRSRLPRGRARLDRPWARAASATQALW
jgi:hypothetical protein